MPRQSIHQVLLNDLASARQDLQLIRFQDLVHTAINLLDSSSSDKDTDSQVSDSDSSTSGMSSDSSLSNFMVDTFMSLLETSEASFIAGLTLNHQILSFENTIVALMDEVEKSCYLAAHTKAPHAPQLQLLEEWCLNNDLKKFHCKLCVDPNIFASLIAKLENHPIFSNNSNNPQLPVSVQLTIFLNGVSHYGNGATMEDIAEWAGVSIGMVYKCYCRVMITLLQLHNDVIHFDPMEPEDQEEWDWAK
ncbi:hypothetical protein PISMIDRAFT_17487 [Pisolithus microcarpus 441]|uniref:Uncharacterized protein n=1 Tax=Pisolithus microcarpus 441 TaxID=765257 RepID=A0A0C9YBG0_9AGAM|nr:hypothetical protein PISMIDRAFT_17487 [Pisolithus microcarpus 441]